MNPSTAFYHIPHSIIQERCLYLHHLDPSERCEFVKKSLCDEHSAFVKYHNVMFCGIPNPSFDNPYILLFIFGMLVWIFVLFLILAITVDEYFCPAIGQISKLLHLSENLSGVTLLAWGNGAADILSGITAGAKGDTILMFNQVLGSAMFVSCIVVGSIVFSRPFYVQPYYFLRDTIFTLFAVVWITTSTRDEHVSIWEACSYIGLYLFYLIVVILGILIQDQLQKYIKVAEVEVEWTEMRKRRASRDLNAEEELRLINEKLLADKRNETEDGKTETIRQLFRDFFISISPIQKDEWKAQNCCDRFMDIIKTPFVVVLNIIVPVYSAGVKRNGWSKLLNCMQCIYYPSFILFGIGVLQLEVANYPLVLYIGPIGLLMAVVIFCTSRQNKPPRYHCIFAFIAFTMGMIIIFLTVKEMVAVLSLFGTFVQIAPQTLGITVLAWGNSLGDAVANIKIAKQGFQRMAFAACFAGIMANCLLTMGITFLVKNLQNPVQNEARGGIMGPNCSTFIVMNLVFNIIFVLFTKFQARKSYGIFLVLIYIEFLAFCVMCELELIHPLGTDHEFSKAIFQLTNHNVSGT